MDCSSAPARTTAGRNPPVVGDRAGGPLHDQRRRQVGGDVARPVGERQTGQPGRRTRRGLAGGGVGGAEFGQRLEHGREADQVPPDLAAHPRAEQPVQGGLLRGRQVRARDRRLVRLVRRRGVSHVRQQQRQRLVEAAHGHRAAERAGDLAQDHQVGRAAGGGGVRVVGVQHLDDQAGDLVAGQPGQQRGRGQVPGQLVVLAGDPGLPGGRDEAVADPVLRQVEDDDGALGQQRPADPGEQVLPPLRRPAEDVEPGDVLVRRDLEPARGRRDALRLGVLPGGLAALIVFELGGVPDGPFFLLAAQPGGDAATPQGELDQRQPAADRQRRPHSPEPAPVGDGADQAEEGKREQADDDQQSRPQRSRRVRRAQRRCLGRVGIGYSRRRCRVLTSPQPRFVRDPAKVQPHTRRLEPEPPRIKFDGHHCDGADGNARPVRYEGFLAWFPS